jgi:hypothetical protein
VENHRHGFYLILRQKDQITHLTLSATSPYTIDVVSVIIETPADSDFQRLLWLRRWQVLRKK